MSNKQQYVNDLLNIIMCPLFEEYAIGLWMTWLNLLPSVDLQNKNISVINALCNSGPTIHETYNIRETSNRIVVIHQYTFYRQYPSFAF